MKSCRKHLAASLQHRTGVEVDAAGVTFVDSSAVGSLVVGYRFAIALTG